MSDPSSATKSEELSDPGSEKLIPIRFVNVSCAGCASANYDGVLRSLDAANDVFKAAGIQFWLRSVERFELTHFYDLANASCGGTGYTDVPWETVRDEMKQVFPDTYLNAWSGLSINPRQWLAYVQLRFSRSDEITVVIPHRVACSPQSYSAGPSQSRNLVMDKGTMNGSPYTFPHELGHFFGLVHTFEDPTVEIDPQTNQPFLKSNAWDLMYSPGPPLKFFSSRAEAAGYEATLTRIEAVNGTCTKNPPGYPVDTVKCAVQGTDYFTGDGAMKGMGFVFAEGRGDNVMSYIHTSGSRALSNSQIELVRKAVRWDAPLRADIQQDVWPSGQLTGRRPQLGSWNLRGSGSLGMIDFDGDGRRDIGVWIPPTAMGTKGTFKVLLSSQGHSADAGSHMNLQFGELGDVVVPGDYGCVIGQPGCTTGMEPDGRTDLAVYQPGGGFNRSDPSSTQGWWRWCPTHPSPQSMTSALCDCPKQNCATGFVKCGNQCQRVATPWGLRQDVPLPGLNFLGASTSEVAVFRPSSNGLWAWRQADSDSSSGPYRNLGGRGSVPLAGLYDNDFLTDIAVYEVETAIFKLLRSEQSWNTYISRGFPSTFVPQYSHSDGELRAAAVPLEGAYKLVNIGGTNHPRSVPSVWFPRAGKSEASCNCLWSVITRSVIKTGTS